MAQRLIQTQEQKLQQVQRLSQQQMLMVRLLEMPITELEQAVMAEVYDNPALEPAAHEESIDNSYEQDDDNDGDMTFDEQQEREERDDAMTSALERIGQDDDMIESVGATYQGEEREPMVFGDTVSFYDKLKEQMGEVELTDIDAQIMEYLIGSLDEDGLLRKDSDTIADEMAIYRSLYVEADDVDRVVAILQTFDPAGIGAHTLQECLLLQIDRRPDDRLKPLMKEVIENHFESFKRKRWDPIRSALRLTTDDVELLQHELRKLNPKPGAALGEVEGRSLQQITPDFIVDTADDGTLTLTLNDGNLPELRVSEEFDEMLESLKKDKKNLSRADKEALVYLKDKVDKANGFIDAVKQRRHTLLTTMRAIIKWQRKFFTEGDESELRPMILKDIADKTGLDISTISRVSNVKYVQTRWGTFPLRFFFTESYTTESGEELSTRKIKLALKDIIDSEDKHHPYSDERLTQMMKEKGMTVARRTVAKYREQLGIPVARLRKE
jgi:RNA polymerase sigma-54 factor